MKNITLLLALASVFLSGCISSREKVREDVLIPAALLAYENDQGGVRADVERGLQDAVESGDLGSRGLMDGYLEQLHEALQMEDPSYLQFAAIPWAELESYGYRGIEVRVALGELHPLAAESFYERLRNFGEAMARLSSPVVYFLPPSQDGRANPIRTQAERTFVAQVR